MREAKLNKKMPDETKRKISESAKLAWEDPDYRNVASQERKARWNDPIYRAKVTQASIDRWNDPDYRARMGKHTRLAKKKEKRHGS